MSKIKYELMWLAHNCVSHPIMGILNLFGFIEAGNWVHDITVPKEDNDNA